MLLHIPVIGITSDWDIFMPFSGKEGKLMAFFNSAVGAQWDRYDLANRIHNVLDNGDNISIIIIDIFVIYC